MSFFLTLGISAIDLLTCAFVASVVLFLVFLAPRASGKSDYVGGEDAFLVYWTIGNGKQAVVGIEIGNERNIQFIPSDVDEDALGDQCRFLTKSKEPKASCYLANTRPSRSSEAKTENLGGILLVKEPAKGNWQVGVSFSDTADWSNAGNYEPIILDITVVRNEATTFENVKLNPGEQVDLFSIAKSVGKDAELAQILKIE